MKRMNIYKGYIPRWPDEFSHRWACWAYNHRGWAKQKKTNKRLAKKRERRTLRKEIKDGMDEGC